MTIVNRPSTLRLATWVLFAAVLLGLFYRFLSGEVLFWGLPSLQFYPWREFAMSELAQGRLPLWNPYNGAGAPLLANYQSALLYPPNFLYFLLPGPQTMGVLGVLHVAWAGLGMWKLTGRWKLPILGQGIALFAFPLSTALIARFGTFPMIDVAAWLPWLLLAVDGLIERSDLPRLILLAIVVAMQLLAGHAQWTFYGFVLAAAYGVWQLAAQWRAVTSPERPKAPFARIVLMGVLGLVLAVGIAAAQLVPTAELQRQSQRAGGVDEEFAFNFSFAPVSLFTLFNPHFFGNPGDGSYQIPNLLYYETAAYVGFLPLCLAILLSVRVLNRRLRRIFRRPTKASAPDDSHPLVPFFLIAAVVSLVFAFGKYGLAYVFLYRSVPTFNMFQAPARWLLITVFSLVVLAALATPQWKPVGRVQVGAWLGAIVSAAIIIAGVAMQLILKTAVPITLQLERGATTIGVLLLVTSILFLTQPKDEARQARWILTVLLFVAVDVWWADRLLNPTVPASFYDRQSSQASATASGARAFWVDSTVKENLSLPQFAFNRYLSPGDYRVAVTLQADYRKTGLPDMNLLDRQPLLNNFDPLRPAGVEDFIRLLNTVQTPGLLKAGLVGTIYDYTGQAKQVSTAELARAWIVGKWTTAASLSEAVQTVSASNWTPDDSEVVEGLAPPQTGNSATGSASITQETPLDLTLNVTVNGTGTGLLVIADTYYPGWVATVDEAPATIYRANVAFRAVPVQPGQHIVRLSYRPRSVIAGAAISAVSILILCALALSAVVRRRAAAR